MGPTLTIMQGISSLPAAISMPGVILSQAVKRTRPSSAWAFATVSTSSAINSLEGREKCIPSCPIAIPSQIAGRPNSKATPPPLCTPFAMICERSLMLMCPGTRSVKLLATPMKGFSRLPFVTPVACSSDLWGALSMPFFTLSLFMRTPPGYVNGIISSAGGVFCIQMSGPASAEEYRS